MAIRIPKWLIVVIIAVLFGFIDRTYHLSERPFHHDEAIHSTLSLHWFNNPETGYYKYDPVYHGTFLYASLRFIYEIFGVGVVQARLFPLIFGIGVWFLPLLFRRWLGNVAVAIAFLGLAVSPLFTFYSRFIVHDMPTIFFTFLGIYGLFRYFGTSADTSDHERRRWLYLMGASFGVLQAIKLVSFINFFVLGTFGLFWALHTTRGKIAALRKWHIDWIGLGLGLVVFLFVFSYINTAGFKALSPIWDGLFGKNLEYWWGQHKVERVKGPVAYHLYSMFLHELPFLLIGTFASLRAASRLKHGRTLMLLVTVVFAFTVPRVYWLRDYLNPSMVGLLDHFKVKQSIDIFLYVLCLVSGLGATWTYLSEGKLQRGFWCFWTFISLAIFSFAGEKGPWLTPHVAFPFIIFASICLADWCRRFFPSGAELQLKSTAQKVIVGMGILAMCYQARIAIWVNHITDGEPSDVLSQVHNSRDVTEVLDWMKRTSYQTGEKPDKMGVAVLGETTWAFYFYLLAGGYHNFKFDQASLNGQEMFVVADEGLFKTMEEPMKGKGYRVSKLVLNGWYTPEDFNPTWVHWFQYAWNRRAINTGTRPMFVFYRTP